MGEYEELSVGREKAFVLFGNVDVTGIASELGKALNCEFELKKAISGNPYGFIGYIPHFVVSGDPRQKR